jgi:hypothetical protein
MITATRRTRYVSQANELTLMVNALGYVPMLLDKTLLSRQLFVKQPEVLLYILLINTCIQFRVHW